MSRKFILGASTILAVGSLAVGFLVGQGREHTERSNERLTGELMPTTGSVSDHARTLDALERLARARASARPEDDREQESEGDREQEPGEAQAGEDAKSDWPAKQETPALVTLEQSQGHVLSAFADERVDPAWSHEASRSLERLVRGHLPSGSRVQSIECRTTMCEVEVFHANASAHGPFIVDGFSGWPGSVFVAAEKEERGSLSVKFIAFREGAEPPFEGPLAAQ